MAIKEGSMKKAGLTLLTVMIGLFVVISIGAAAGRPFTTTLTGAAEIPGPGDPDGIGTAALRLNLGQGEICYTLEVSGIAPAAAAHIQVIGPLGFGPVVVPLVPPTDGSSSACATDVSRDLIKAIIQHPENYYVNVHNADYPSGALRGDLSK
jgi:hypothetical protein